MVPRQGAGRCGDAAGPLSGPRRQRPECPSFLGVGCCASRRLSDDDDDGGPGVAALGSAGVPGSLCQVKPDSTAAVAVAIAGAVAVAGARHAVQRADRQTGWEPGTETWMQDARARTGWGWA